MAETAGRRLLVVLLFGLLFLLGHGQHAFGATPVSLLRGTSRGILFQRILDDNHAVAKVLLMHQINGRIRGLKRIIRHKGVSLEFLRLFVHGQVWRSNERSKSGKGIVQNLLRDGIRIEIAHKQVGTDIARIVGTALVRTIQRRFAHPDGAAI